MTDAAAETSASRWLRLGLAALWLLDAALQVQSFMFGPGLARMLAAAAHGNPALVAGPITWAAQLVWRHPVAASAGFATVQAALGLGIAWRPATRIALGASIGWAVAVWWLGEGFGGLLSGTASPVSGAPGAVIVYALLAFLLRPASGNAPAPGRGGAFPAARGGGPAAARAVWLLLWGGLAGLALAGAARGAPPVAPGFPPASLLLAAAFAAIAAGVLLPPPGQRAAVVAAAGLSLTLWAAGQGFGGLLSGTATDPSTGPVLALLAVAYWPGRRAPRAAGSPCPAAGREPAAPAALPAAGRDITVMQILMGVGMAGLLLPGLDPLPGAVWAVLAAAGMAWFGWRLCRDLARRSGGHDHVPHLLACGAMLYMALAAGAAPGPAGTPAMGAAGLGAAGAGPVVALILAAALAGCAVMLADRLGAVRTAAPGAASAFAPPGTAAGNAAAGYPARPAATQLSGRSLLVPRLAVCCQVAMGFAMACMLVQML